MSGHGRGGQKVYKLRDSSGLVWPQMFPVRSDEMSTDLIGEAAALLRDMARRVTSATDDVAASWAGLQGGYVSPEAPRVYTLMTPAQATAEQVALRLNRAANAVDAYSDELEGLRGRIDRSVTACETFRASCEGGVMRDAASTAKGGAGDYLRAGGDWIPGVDERKVLVPWDQDQDLINRNEDLIEEYSQVVADVTTAAARCANTVSGLHELLPVFMAPYAGGITGASPEQLVAGWGPAVEEDRSCVQRVGSGGYNEVQMGLVSLASLAGRDPVTKKWSPGTALESRLRAEWALGDLGVSTVTTFGITAPLALPSAVGRLTGHPELGDYAPDWFQDRGTRVGDTVADFFGGDSSEEYVWESWHDDGWQAFGAAGFNVATIVAPTKLSLLKGTRAAEGAAVEGAGAADAVNGIRSAGGIWAARVGVRGIPSASGLLNQADHLLAASRAGNANPAKTVLTTLDRVPDNLSRPVSDDLFSNPNRAPRTDPAPRAPSTVHNPQTAPERAPATAAAHTHPDTPPSHPSPGPGRAADTVTTQPIQGLPRAQGSTSPAHPGDGGAPGGNGPARPGGGSPDSGPNGTGGDRPTTGHEDPPGTDGPKAGHDGQSPPRAPDADDVPPAAEPGTPHQPGGAGRVLEPVGGGEPLTQPTGMRGGTPTGPPEFPHPNADLTTIHALQRQNEAADTLARMGYEVEHQPTASPSDSGVALGKRPDYRIEGKIFDGFTPLPGTKVENVYMAVLKKVDKLQAPRVLVNLDDSPLSVVDLHRYFTDNPIRGLEEVVVVRGDTVQQIYP